MKNFIEVENAVEAVMKGKMSNMDIGIGLSELEDKYPGYLADISVFLKSNSKDISFNIAHDIYGMKSGNEFFEPRLAGYAKRNKGNN